MYEAAELDLPALFSQYVTVDEDDDSSPSFKNKDGEEWKVKVDSIPGLRKLVVDHLAFLNLGSSFSLLRCTCYLFFAGETISRGRHLFIAVLFSSRGFFKRICQGEHILQ